MSIFSSQEKHWSEKIAEAQTVEELKELCKHPPSDIQCESCKRIPDYAGAILIPEGLCYSEGLPNPGSLSGFTVYRCTSRLYGHDVSKYWEKDDSRYAWRILNRCFNIFAEAYEQAYLRALAVPILYNGRRVSDTIRIYFNDKPVPDYSLNKSGTGPIEKELRELFGNTDFADIRRIMAFALLPQHISSCFTKRLIDMERITKVEIVVNNSMIDLNIHYDSVIRGTSIPMSRIIKIVTDPEVT